MRVETMRAVDRGLGRPLAFLLTLLRRVTPRRRPPEPAAVRKVLFVKLSEMGALVLAAPAVAEARRVFPAAECFLLCFGENGAVAEVCGFPRERQITVGNKGLGQVIGGLIRAILRIRRESMDVVVDLEYFSRVSALLSGLSGAPVRVGFHRFEAEGLYCGDLYTHRATFNPYLHIAQSMVMLVRAAARDPRENPLPKDVPPELSELTFPRFRPEKGDVAAVRELLTEAGVPDDARIVVVNPNSSDLLPLRRWPEENFVGLCKGILAARSDAWIVLTGVQGEHALGERIRGAVGGGRCVSLIGRTTIRQLLALFTLCRVLVSADSGPPHFAVLCGTRGVTLFGPETPLLYGPVNPRNRAVTANLACSPCINAWNRRVSTCDDNQCMKRITVAQVVAASLAAVDAEGD